MISIYSHENATQETMKEHRKNWPWQHTVIPRSLPMARNAFGFRSYKSTLRSIRNTSLAVSFPDAELDPSIRGSLPSLVGTRFSEHQDSKFKKGASVGIAAIIVRTLYDLEHSDGSILNTANYLGSVAILDRFFPVQDPNARRVKSSQPVNWNAYFQELSENMWAKSEVDKISKL